MELTKKQLEAFSRIADSPDGKAFLDCLFELIDENKNALVQADKEQDFREIQGRCRMTCEIHSMIAGASADLKILEAVEQEQDNQAEGAGYAPPVADNSFQ